MSGDNSYTQSDRKLNGYIGNVVVAASACFSTRPYGSARQTATLFGRLRGGALSGADEQKMKHIGA
jgi:hypothetical protein